MATATAAHARPTPATASASRHTNPIPPPPQPPPLSHPSPFAVEVERDEAWVQQLEEEQHQRFAQQAGLMHKEHLEELERAGPFATTETRTALQARYDQRLEQMRAMQQEELEGLIEMERQERLWSLGLQNEDWDGWNRVREEQAAILANIRRAAARDDEATVQDRIRENAREADDVGRRSEEWQRTEPQRVADRARWAERTRLTNSHVGERRERDLAEARNQAAQRQAREAQLRETLGNQSESAPSSRPDSVFSGTSAASIDTPPSSVQSDRKRSSPAISIPTPTDDARRSLYTDDMHRASPIDDMRRASPARQSPLSSTPTSHTMAYAKGDEARPTVWIPPEGTRGPARKGSTFFEGREPARKQSGQFDAREPARKPSGQFGAQDDPARRAYQASPSPQPPAPSQPQQPPNAPPMRTAPLPSGQPSYPQPQQYPQQPQPQQYQATAASASSARPTAPSQPAAPSPQRKQEPATPPRTAPPPASSARPTPSPTTARPSPSTARPTLAASPTTARQPSAPTAGSRPAPAPAATAGRGPPPFANDPAEERRRHLREEYVAAQAQRAEDEQRRQRDEENERRAEEARRRGAEKRRAEEEARETERREAERKEAERRARAGAGAGVGTGKMGKPVDMSEVWAAYENQWAAMASATQLRFRSIPWPVSTPVFEPAGLLPVLVAAFVLSPAHSQGKARKDRLREALLRWHPDRFEAKWLRKVVEDERETVKEGVGLVVRALNELLSTEGTFGA